MQGFAQYGSASGRTQHSFTSTHGPRQNLPHFQPPQFYNSCGPNWIRVQRHSETLPTQSHSISQPPTYNTYNMTLPVRGHHQLNAPCILHHSQKDTPQIERSRSVPPHLWNPNPSLSKICSMIIIFFVQFFFLGGERRFV